MKAELRVDEHLIHEGVTVFEVWHDGEFLATIVPGDGPSVKVISKHWLHPELRTEMNVASVTVVIERRPN